MTTGPNPPGASGFLSRELSDQRASPLNRPNGLSRSSVEARADGREPAGGLAAEERDGEDADHGDEGHEEGVLDERGTTLVVDACPKPVGEELVRGDHFGIAPLV